jgi:hypothetical protein
MQMGRFEVDLSSECAWDGVHYGPVVGLLAAHAEVDYCVQGCDLQMLS